MKKSDAAFGLESPGSVAISGRLKRHPSRYAPVLVVATLIFPGYPQLVAHEPRASGTTFFNGAGVAIPEESLRFAEGGWVRGRDQGYALALQRGTNHFYVWIQGADGVPIGRHLYCDGGLLDRNGDAVAVDTIHSFTHGDLLGKGSDFLIAGRFSGDSVDFGNRLIAWNLAECKGEGNLTATAESLTSPSGKSGGSLQGEIHAGDFDGTGIDLVQMINPRTAELSQWRLDLTEFRLVRRTFLTISATSKSRIRGITYVGITRLPHDRDNIAYEAATMILHDRGFTLARNEKAISFAPNCSYRPSVCTHKTLLFNLDQGLSDGLQDLARKDRVSAGEAIGRVIKALRRAQQHYVVWAMINPIQQERDATIFILDKLAVAGIPFVLDYYSSDVTTLASIRKDWLDYAPQAFAPLKGLSLRVDGPPSDADSVAFYNRRYGEKFIGLRFMERLGIDISARDPRGRPMIEDEDLAKRELVFDWQIAKRTLEWAKAHGKLVIWADPAMYLPYECYLSRSELEADSKSRDEYLAQEERVTAEFPNLVPVYDNNEGLKRCGVEYGNWLMTPRNFRLVGWERIPIALQKRGSTPLTGSKGFGVSIQSWTTDYDPVLTAGTLPSEEIIIWTLDAFAKGTPIVELEPYFYFFAWPPSQATGQSLQLSTHEKIGDARDTLELLFATLGISTR